MRPTSVECHRNALYHAPGRPIPASKEAGIRGKVRGSGCLCFSYMLSNFRNRYWGVH